MKVRVNYTTQLKAALGLSSQDIHVELPCTASQLIQQLGQQHGPAFQQLVQDEHGELLPSILLCVGNEQASRDGALPLKEGDDITIVSAISGG